MKDREQILACMQATADTISLADLKDSLSLLGWQFEKKVNSIGVMVLSAPGDAVELWSKDYAWTKPFDRTVKMTVCVPSVRRELLSGHVDHISNLIRTVAALEADSAPRSPEVRGSDD